jgi:hypothetical protein
MITPNMEQHFLKATNYHVNLVRNNLQFFIDNWYYPHALRQRALIHDKDKLAESERNDFIIFEWMNHCILNNIEFSYPEGFDIEDIKNRHIKNNSYYPEFYDHPDDMSEIDMIEMACDWFAKSEEHGEHDQEVYRSTCRFAEKVLGKKYKFNNENINKIYFYIDLLNNFRTKVENNQLVVFARS